MFMKKGKFGLIVSKGISVRGFMIQGYGRKFQKDRQMEVRKIDRWIG